jgi:phage baseplate assembly protein W
MDNTTSKYEKFLKKGFDKKRVITDVMPLISPLGDLTKIEDIDVIVQSIVNIILTPKRTYIFDPEYGCDLYKYIFEPADDRTKNSIQSEIISSIGRYESRANISADVEFLSDKKGFNVSISIQYKDRKKKTTITIDESILKTLPPDSIGYV